MLNTHLLGAVASILVVLAACGEGSETPQEVTLENGGTLTASDGAKVQFPALSSTLPVSGSFEKTADATGEVTDERRSVSAEYVLTLQGAAPISNLLTVTIPLVAEHLPENPDGVTLTPEYFDEDSHEWIPIRDLAIYDAATQQLTFDIVADLPLEMLPLEESPDEEGKADRASSASALTQPANFSRRYRIGIWLFSSKISVSAPDSPFTIIYYPAALAAKYSVKKDEVWNSQTGNAVDSQIPDFIEDLNVALNQTYKGLLAIDHGAGKLFSELKGSQFTVYVTDTGGAAGSSPIGGPLSISNNLVSSWADMRGTVAHELVHVMQGEYYIGGTAGNVVNLIFSQNRWFIEASAHYYASVALGLSEAERRVHYTDPPADRSLSVSITAPDDNSMYGLAHFLEWIAATYGTEVVGEALKSSKDALVALDQGITAKDAEDTISSAFAKYASYLATEPESFGGLNQTLISNIANYNGANRYLIATRGEKVYTPSLFNNLITHIELKRTLPKMSMTIVGLKTKNKSNALAVIDTPTITGTPLQQQLFDVEGSTNATFQGKSPLDGLGTIKDCGSGQACTGFTHIVVNTSQSASQELSVNYTLLVTPAIKEVSQGKVSWSTAELGNIPAARLSGYNVLRMND